jgi:hypothetical protein
MFHAADRWNNRAVDRVHSRNRPLNLRSGKIRTTWQERF